MVILFNVLTKLKNYVEEAFSTMDVYLKKRWDLIPNLVEVVKAYAKHEKQTLKEVAEMRSLKYDNMSQAEKIKANTALTDNIIKLVAVSEQYPKLCASEEFKNLSTQLTKIEDELVNARKYYNGSVRHMNNTIQMFPNNIISRLFKFKKYEMFEIEREQKENIIVNI